MAFFINLILNSLFLIINAQLNIYDPIKIDRYLYKYPQNITYKEQEFT